jgi:hypothetical protein
MFTEAQLQFQQLLQQVQTRLGFPVQTARDCEVLAEQIVHSTGLQVSRDTLRRVFGLIAYQSKPSKFTLDALAQYAGYPGGWAEFVASLKPSVPTKEGLYLTLESGQEAYNLTTAISIGLRQMPENQRAKVYQQLAESSNLLEYMCGMDNLTDKAFLDALPVYAKKKSTPPNAPSPSASGS